MMNRFVRTLVIVNGLIIPVFIVFLLYNYISTFINKGIDYEAEGIIVGDELEIAKKDSLALQGLSYDHPQEIYNSTNMYMPISVLTYKESRKLKLDSESAGDLDQGWFNYFNVLFVDKDYKVIGQLLEKKASISEIFINRGEYSYEAKSIDKSVKNIVYKIGFDDSNKDGKLDYMDDHDLYISDLEGKNLTEVTVQKQIIGFNFINLNTEIFIQYKDRNGLRDEYNHVKFGVYNISTGLFKELKEIESKLIDIESKLIK